jgi:hypothetical protein
MENRRNSTEVKRTDRYQTSLLQNKKTSSMADLVVYKRNDSIFETNSHSISTIHETKEETRSAQARIKSLINQSKTTDDLMNPITVNYGSQNLYGSTDRAAGDKAEKYRKLI